MIISSSMIESIRSVKFDVALPAAVSDGDVSKVGQGRLRRSNAFTSIANR